MGAGAVVGGLATAFRSRPSTRLLAGIGLVFGVAILAVALAPTEAWALVLLVPMGAASISFVATNNATLQLRADPAMRGRVMSLNAIAFLGSTPIGAPLLGYISDITNPRVALLVGGVATLVASVPLFVLGARQRREGTEARSWVLPAVATIERDVIAPRSVEAESSWRRSASGAERHRQRSAGGPSSSRSRASATSSTR